MSRCLDCAHAKRCIMLLGESFAPDGPCDWDPSRFEVRAVDLPEAFSPVPKKPGKDGPTGPWYVLTVTAVCDTWEEATAHIEQKAGRCSWLQSCYAFPECQPVLTMAVEHTGLEAVGLIGWKRDGVKRRVKGK